MILKNENVLNEMVEILDELHKYVPTKQTTQEFEVVHGEDQVEHISLKVDHFHHILLGGDQLTIARVRGCQRIRNNSENGRACLEGFFPIIEDWHTKMCYMKVSYPLILYIHTHNYMYSIMVCPQKIVSVSTGMHVTTSVLLDSPHFHIRRH